MSYLVLRSTSRSSRSAALYLGTITTIQQSALASMETLPLLQARDWALLCGYGIISSRRRRRRPFSWHYIYTLQRLCLHVDPSSPSRPGMGARHILHRGRALVISYQVHYNRYILYTSIIHKSRYTNNIRHEKYGHGFVLFVLFPAQIVFYFEVLYYHIYVFCCCYYYNVIVYYYHTIRYRAYTCINYRYY